MFAILNVIIPVFALMTLGNLAVRFRLYPAEGIKGLIAFVNNFATPCLLFQAMSTADFGAAFNFSVILPFYCGALFALFAGTLIGIRVFGKRPGEGAASGFAAMFTNTVLIGIPILQRAYGEAAMPAIYSIIAFHAPSLLTFGMLFMELMRRDGASLSSALRSALLRAAQNPLLWGVGLGALVNVLGLPLPEPIDAFLSMMASSVVPVALFALGGALLSYKLGGSWLEAAVMSGLKLVIHPLVAYLLMVPVLGVDPDIARYGVLLAAMPSGINSYVFATYYNRGVDVAANTVLISTLASVLTITGWLAFFSL